ncbi:MAG: hypothetical protein MK135_09010, partial [Polyangiaceae bacterium]|nr:hypothetical protein [Polyangiaceae bacterium]
TPNAHARILVEPHIQPAQSYLTPLQEEAKAETSAMGVFITINEKRALTLSEEILDLRTRRTSSQLYQPSAQTPLYTPGDESPGSSLEQQSFSQSLRMAALVTFPAFLAAFFSPAQPHFRATDAILYLATLGIPLITAATFWAAAKNWSSLGNSSALRYGASRRKKLARVQLQLCVRSTLLALSLSALLLMVAHQNSQRLLQDLGVSLPAIGAIALAQGAITALFASSIRRFGVILATIVGILGAAASTTAFPLIPTQAIGGLLGNRPGNTFALFTILAVVALIALFGSAKKTPS